MATYKVIQDIEAEDKLVGPLSFRQFVYGLVAAFCFYLSFIVATKGAAFMLIVFLPPGLLAAFFAFPFGKDQPTEVWALAKLRFLFKPRRRIWDQSGMKDLVSITVPKKVEEVRTNGLSQTEVKSRLSALANTIDSRGWAVKNVNLNLYAQPDAATAGIVASDRLVDLASIPQEVPADDIQAADDILDEQNNPVAHQFDEMITASSQAHRQQLMAMMNHQSAPAAGGSGLQLPAVQAASDTSAPADYWFLNQPVEPPALAPNQATFTAASVVTTQPAANLPIAGAQVAEPTAEEEALAEKLKEEHARPNLANSHLKMIQPLDASIPNQAAATPLPAPAQTAQSTPSQPVTPRPDPAILELANNNDLNVATLARQAHKSRPELPDEGEVVIALH